MTETELLRAKLADFFDRRVVESSGGGRHGDPALGDARAYRIEIRSRLRDAGAAQSAAPAAVPAQ